jgi:hypothetical protein
MVTITITVPMLEITQVGLLAKKLNTSELLSNAGNYSTYYSFSIARWVQKKRMLAWRNELQYQCSSKPFDLPTKQSTTPEPNPDMLFDCLTIGDWRQLAAYEMPSTGTPDQIGGEIRRDIDVSVGALPRRVDQASFAVAALLVFTLLYFGAFLREATHSERFPADATLFGAFFRTRPANLLMLLAQLIPPLSSLAVAIVSKSWLLYVEFVLVGLATAWIFVGFQQKSYFTSSATLIREKLKLRPSQKSKPESPNSDPK